MCEIGCLCVVLFYCARGAVCSWFVANNCSFGGSWLLLVLVAAVGGSWLLLVVRGQQTVLLVVRGCCAVLLVVLIMFRGSWFVAARGCCWWLVAVLFCSARGCCSALLVMVLSTHLGRKPEDIIKLDANENPYGPPPEVFEALGTMKFPYVYPDPESRRLRAALAEDSGLDSDNILVGCGADELIDLIMRCVLEPGDKIVDCPPTFTMYEFDANVNGAVVLKAPRHADFRLDVEEIARIIELEKPKCIFLTSPNNPDGSIISDEVLLKILDLPVLVILDEAYIEFSGLESRMKWVKQHENLIVLRTFSKRAGLAGLRVGYGAFPSSIIEYLWRAKQPYNVSVAAELAACAALQNPTYLENVKEALVKEREKLFKLLLEVPFLKPFPSYSNFILCEVTSGLDAKKLKEDLSKMGVMIRHYNNKILRGYVRISVGKPEHTDALMKCLKHFY